MHSNIVNITVCNDTHSRWYLTYIFNKYKIYEYLVTNFLNIIPNYVDMNLIYCNLELKLYFLEYSRN